MGVLSEELRDQIRAQFPNYPNKRAVVLPALHLVQDAQRHVSIEAVREIAEEEVKQSDHIWLFLATPNGFFFSQCKDIVRTGAIQPLSPEWVSPEIQRGYLGLLKEFIR